MKPIRFLLGILSSLFTPSTLRNPSPIGPEWQFIVFGIAATLGGAREFYLSGSPFGLAVACGGLAMAGLASTLVATNGIIFTPTDEAGEQFAPAPVPAPDISKLVVLGFGHFLREDERRARHLHGIKVDLTPSADGVLMKTTSKIMTTISGFPQAVHVEIFFSPDEFSRGTRGWVHFGFRMIPAFRINYEDASNGHRAVAVIAFASIPEREHALRELKKTVAATAQSTLSPS